MDWRVGRLNASGVASPKKGARRGAEEDRRRAEEGPR